MTNYAQVVEVLLKTQAVKDAVEKTGKEPYGDVTYADPGYRSDKKKRYPIDTEAHIRAAWNYINHPDNANQYGDGDAAKVKARILSAWKKKIDSAGPPSAKAVAGGLQKATFLPEELEGHSNVTSLVMRGTVSNGVFSPSAIEISDMNYDPEGQEETPGSPAEAMEEQHYERVIQAVSDFLTSKDGHEKLQAEVEKYNENHDEKGQFASGSSSGGGKSSGKGKDAKDPRDKRADTSMVETKDNKNGSFKTVNSEGGTCTAKVERVTSGGQYDREVAKNPEMKQYVVSTSSPKGFDNGITEDNLGWHMASGGSRGAKSMDVVSTFRHSNGDISVLVKPSKG